MENRMEKLIKELNIYCDAYYNRVSLVSDEEYDKLYDELVELEKQMGYTPSNSPTKRVGFEVVSNLKKVEHKHKLYSLSKTKSADELEVYFGSEDCISSLKLDGLTTEIEYKGGKLFRASTRGDGLVGEDITHAVKVYKNIPLQLSHAIDITVVGESIIKLGDFKHFNSKLSDADKFKNARNAVSGTVRNLDSRAVRERSVRFISFDILDIADEYRESSYTGTLKLLGALGFNTVPNVSGQGLLIYEQLKKYAKLTGFGIDGVVVRINDNEIYKSKGFNSKFPLGAKAYKFEDESEETTLIDIEWSVGRTGVLTPVAVFDPVELDGTTVERASLHNLSQIEKLNLGGTGTVIKVQKSNQIIPQVIEVSEKIGEPNIPSRCPHCGEVAVVEEENASKIVKCSNDECIERLVMCLSYYASRPCLNIKGLSEQHLRTFVNHGLISNISDIYTLQDSFNYIKNIEGFGLKSAKAIIENIEKSKTTKLDKFICGLGIQHIGSTVSKDIAKHVKNLDGLFRLSLDDSKKLFGDVKGNSLFEFVKRNRIYIILIANHLSFEEQALSEGVALDGLSVCITGTCEEFKNRDELKAFITSNGAKVSAGVTSKTSYLVANSVEDSSKYKKALSLGVKIITEKELKALCE